MATAISWGIRVISNIELLQQLAARYPHFEFFTAGKSDRQPKLSAAIIGRANHLDLHLARHRGDFAIGGDYEVIIELAQCCWSWSSSFMHRAI